MNPQEKNAITINARSAIRVVGGSANHDIQPRPYLTCCLSMRLMSTLGSSLQHSDMMATIYAGTFTKPPSSLDHECEELAKSCNHQTEILRRNAGIESVRTTEMACSSKAAARPPHSKKLRARSEPVQMVCETCGFSVYAGGEIFLARSIALAGSRFFFSDLHNSSLEILQHYSLPAKAFDTLSKFKTRTLQKPKHAATRSPS